MRTTCAGAAWLLSTESYTVATVDWDVKRRIRKVPGVTIMYISNCRYNAEQMPDDCGALQF